MVWNVEGPATLRLRGDVDFRRALGEAEVVGAGSSFTLQWNARTLLAWPGSAPAKDGRGGLPRGVPVSRPLAASRSAVDAVLAVVLGLGRDRPDNAQLIQRNGARWLRADRIAGMAVDVLQGPAARGAATGSGAALRYWLDRSGDLRRVEAFLGGGARMTWIDVDARSFQTFARSPRLRA